MITAAEFDRLADLPADDPAGEYLSAPRRLREP